VLAQRMTIGSLVSIFKFVQRAMSCAARLEGQKASKVKFSWNQENQTIGFLPGTCNKWRVTLRQKSTFMQIFVDGGNFVCNYKTRMPIRRCFHLCQRLRWTRGQR
jgi:hypothetical protein